MLQSGHPRNVTFIAVRVPATNIRIHVMSFIPPHVAEGRLGMALGSEHNNTFGSGVESLVLNEPPELE